MASKSISDLPEWSTTARFDTNGPVGVVTAIHTVDGRTEHHSNDVIAASQAVATAVGGGLTAAQARTVLREFMIAFRAQARTSGGWS